MIALITVFSIAGKEPLRASEPSIKDREEDPGLVK